MTYHYQTSGNCTLTHAFPFSKCNCPVNTKSDLFTIWSWFLLFMMYRNLYRFNFLLSWLKFMNKCWFHGSPKCISLVIFLVCNLSMSQFRLVYFAKTYQAAQFSDVYCSMATSDWLVVSLLLIGWPPFCIYLGAQGEKHQYSRCGRDNSKWQDTNLFLSFYLYPPFFFVPNYLLI